MKPFINVIIKDGWKWDFLTITEYNLIVLFMDMIIKLENIISHKNLSELYFIGFEESFMRIHKNTNYFSMLFDALKKSFNKIEKIKIEKVKEEKEREKLLQAIENIFYIFNYGYLYPSLFDIIFAFNIYQTERFLDYDNFFKQDVISTVETGFYNCSKEIFEEILTYFSNLLKEEERLNAEKERIEWLNTICETDNSNKVFSFYNKILKSWDNDKEDVFYLFLNITKILLEKLDFLFFKEWEALDRVDKVHKIKMLDPSELEPIYQKIYNDFLNLKSKYFASTINRISIEEYKNNENFIDLLNESQKILYEKMLNILSNFKYIADKLQKITNSPSYSKNYDNNLLIAYPEEFKGNSIAEVINHHIEIILQICFYFKESNILSEIKKLQHIIDNIKDIEERLSKISDTNNFIRESFMNAN